MEPYGGIARLLPSWEIEGHGPTRQDDLFRIAEILIFMFDDHPFHKQYPAVKTEYNGNGRAGNSLRKFLTRFNSQLPQKVKEFNLYTLGLNYEDRPKYQEWINRFRTVQ
jgi:hypothetical protein